MLKLFTKKDVREMINRGMTFRQIEDKMGFEDIGQGWGYKNVEAWILGQDNDLSDKYICYIPEYCYDDDTSVKQISVNCCYTRKDIEDLCKYTRYDPDALFESIDWQHPSSLLNEWTEYDEA